MKFVCEVCGKIKNTSEEARSCEEKCKIERSKQEKLNQEKDNCWKEILEKRKELVKLEEKYNNDYKIYDAFDVASKIFGNIYINV